MSNTSLHFGTLLALLLLALPSHAQSGKNPKEGDKKKPISVVPQTGAIYHSRWQHPRIGFRNPDGSDALILHFPDAKAVNFADPKWHLSQIEAMMETEIDFFLPVFAFHKIYQKARVNEHNETSLRALIKALTTIIKGGGRPPHVAMFLDTSFLDNGGMSQKPDMAKKNAHLVLLESIFKFYDILPKQLRFTASGYPVIVVDSSLGRNHNTDLFNQVSDAFLLRYKSRPWIITEKSWQVASTARWQKGAALYGPQSALDVQSIGPGYDDTRTPKRGTPIRKREDGRFYAWSWNKILLSNPTLILIESWNDFANGTGIADSQEYGHIYMDLTRRFIGRLKNHILPDRKKPVRLAHPDPIPRPDKGWWHTQGIKDRVFFVAKQHRSDFGYGLRLGRVDDGSFRRTKTAGISTITPTGKDSTESYLYFGIADEFAYRIGGSYEIEVIVHPATKGELTLQYDSWDRSSPIAGAYKSTPKVSLTGPKSGKNRLIYTLPDPRFGNRQNGGTDFRLAFRGDNFAIIGLQARRLPKKLMTTKAKVELR